MAIDYDQLRSTLIYRADASAEVLMDDLASLQSFDAENEALAAKGGRNGCLGVLLTIAGAAIIFSPLLTIAALKDPAIPLTAGVTGAAIGVVGSATVFLISVGVVIAIVGLVLAVKGYALKSKHGRLDLPDERYLLVQQLLMLLQADVGKDETFAVKIDFNPHNGKDSFERNGKAGYWKVKYYTHQWLEVHGRFVDGVKFSLTTFEKQQDRSRTKRSASGKIKHKSKVKRAGGATLRMRFKSKRFPTFNEVSQLFQQSVRVPGAQLKGVRVGDEEVRLSLKFGADGWSSSNAPEPTL
ncbi:MAG: hypothetical protein QF805_23995, partial [Pirellulaceae bacterium]|nr:hypothetical protein [Pirellulaceae bacterium]